MTITGPSLTISQNTTALELKTFVETGARDKHTKLVAEKTENGVTLYFKSDEKSSLWERMSFTARDRRQLAAETIKQFLGTITEGLKSKTDDPSILNALNSSISRQLGTSRNSALRVDDAKALMTSLVGLEKLGTALKDRQVGPTEQHKRLEDVPNLMVPTGTSKFVTTGMGSMKLPSFSYEGNTYQPVKELGKGSFGSVIMYQTEGEPKSSLAVKVISPHADEKDVKKAEAEGLTHAKLSFGPNKNPNILEMKGAFRTENGSPAIIMEMAPHGNLHEMGLLLSTMTGDGVGQIPERLAKAIAGMLTRDTAEGLKAMHQKGLIHNDSKDMNVMINDKGRAVIMDFGETATLEDSIGGNLLNTNPAYASPTLLLAKSRDDGLLAPIKEQANQTRKEVETIVSSMSFLNPEIRDGMRKVLLQSVDSLEEQKINTARKEYSRENFDAVRNDLWSLGTVALSLFKGDKIGTTDNMPLLRNQRVESHTQVFGEIQQNGVLQANALINKTGDDLLDDLLGHQFSSDREKVLDPGSFVEHPALGSKDMKNDKIRDFIPALKEFGRLVEDQKFALGKRDECLKFQLPKVDGRPYEYETRPYEQLDEFGKKNYDGYQKQVEELQVKIENAVEKFEKEKKIALESMGNV